MKQRITLVPRNITDVTMFENEQYVEVVIGFVATDTPYRIKRTFMDGDNKEQAIAKYNDIYEKIVLALQLNTSIVQI